MEREANKLTYKQREEKSAEQRRVVKEGRWGRVFRKLAGPKCSS